jgi:N-acetylglucosamine-6-phosphate deacetylase
MEGLLFHGGALAAREGHLPRGWLLVEGERIAALGAGDPPAAPGARRVDLAGRVLAPGLIDLHAHGALGYDTMDATPTALREMARFYARHGVTGYLAATVTAPLDEILVALENVARVMAEGTGGARLLGAHVEGPYLDRARLGAQDPRHVRPPAPEEYAALLREGVTRLLTLAPEAPGAAGLIAEAHRRGIVVSAGHTRATYEEMEAAVEWGLRHVTHLFNGMEPLHHRSPGVVGAALTLPALTCELIADGVHVHPAALALAVRARGVAGIVLVTDAMRGAGMPDGRYALGGLDVIVEGGEARLPAGNLAGSTLTLERAVANIIAATGLALHEALPMATANPARVLGLAGRAGALAPGHDADLAVLGEGLRVDLTVVGGEVVYRAEGAAGGAA